MIGSCVQRQGISSGPIHPNSMQLASPVCDSRFMRFMRFPRLACDDGHSRPHRRCGLGVVYRTGAAVYSRAGRPGDLSVLWRVPLAFVSCFSFAVIPSEAESQVEEVGGKVGVLPGMVVSGTPALACIRSCLPQRHRLLDAAARSSCRDGIHYWTFAQTARKHGPPMGTPGLHQRSEIARAVAGEQLPPQDLRPCSGAAAGMTAKVCCVETDTGQRTLHVRLRVIIVQRQQARVSRYRNR